MATCTLVSILNRQKPLSIHPRARAGIQPDYTTTKRTWPTRGPVRVWKDLKMADYSRLLDATVPCPDVVPVPPTRLRYRTPRQISKMIEYNAQMLDLALGVAVQHDEAGFFPFSDQEDRCQFSYELVPFEGEPALVHLVSLQQQQGQLVHGGDDDGDNDGEPVPLMVGLARPSWWDESKMQRELVHVCHHLGVRFAYVQSENDLLVVRLDYRRTRRPLTGRTGGAAYDLYVQRFPWTVPSPEEGSAIPGPAHDRDIVRHAVTSDTALFMLCMAAVKDVTGHAGPGSEVAEAEKEVIVIDDSDDEDEERPFDFQSHVHNAFPDPQDPQDPQDSLDGVVFVHPDNMPSFTFDDVPDNLNYGIPAVREDIPLPVVNQNTPAPHDEGRPELLDIMLTGQVTVVPTEQSNGSPPSSSSSSGADDDAAAQEMFDRFVHYTSNTSSPATTPPPSTPTSIYSAHSLPNEIRVADLSSSSSSGSDSEDVDMSD